MSWFKKKVDDWDMVGAELRRQGVEFDITQIARFKDFDEEEPDEEDDEMVEIKVDATNLKDALAAPKDASATQLKKLKAETEQLLAPKE